MTDVDTWLPPLPTDWTEVRAGTVLTPVRRPTASHDEIVTAFRDGQVTLRSQRRSDGFTYAAHEHGYQGVRRGELVVHSMDAFAGAIGVSDADGKMSPVVHIYTADNDNQHYLAHALRVAASSGYVTALAKGIRERSTSFDRAALKNVILPRPPRPRQDAVVEYLDRETAQIGNLIREQQRLIDLLREHRLALTVQELLGGVHPLTPTSDDGFTKVGHGWDVTLGKMLDSRRPPSVDDVLLPYVRAANIQDHGLALADVKHMPVSPAESRSLNLLAGDVLVVEGGAVGTAVSIEKDMPGWTFQKTVNRLRGRGGQSARWMAHILRAYRDLGVIDVVCDGSTIPHLTAEKLRALRVPSLTEHEQHLIASALDAKTAKIDMTIAEAENFIALSNERRAALITAAVTGQIDVQRDA